MSIEILKSATVSCNKIHFEDFTFLYPSLQAALKQLSSKEKKTPPQKSGFATKTQKHEEGKTKIKPL